MTHVLIIGQTESGKTTFARSLVPAYKKAGINVIVYDPLLDPRWNADYISNDLSEFLRTYWNSRQCAVYFDESGEACEQERHEMTKTATRGRHWGHRNHYIAQRSVLIPRTIRDQCTTLVLFNSGLEDCKIHAAEWNEPAIKEQGPFLPAGEYFHKPRMSPARRGKLF